jgi:hypothetical protein
MNAFRLAVAVAALPLLTACTAIIPIDIAREVTLRSVGGPFAAEQVVDLSASDALWSHRANVDAVSLDEVRATVLSVAAGHRAGAVDLALRFRPEGAPADGSADLVVGTLHGLAFVEGETATLPGSAALDDFLLSVVQGSGRFTAFVSGSFDGPADAVIEVRLLGSLAYKVVGK